MTVAEWAKGLGVSRQAGHQAVQRCNIPLVDGKVDPGVATVLYEQRTRKRVKGGATAEAADGVPCGVAASSAPAAPSAPLTGDYNAMRARREAAEAEEAELRVARAAGRALDRDRAERGAFDAFRELRDGSFAAMKSAARQVVGLVDVREIELELEDALRAAFNGWEDRMRRRLEEAAQQ